MTELSGRRSDWAYDTTYRLTREVLSGSPAGHNGQVDYVMDAVGNRLERSSTLDGVAGQGLAYDANDRVTENSYDANGNTVTSTAMIDLGNGLQVETLTDHYDFEDRLLRRESNVRGLVAEFTYDGDGNRVAKKVLGQTTTYLIDNNNLTGYAQVVEERTGDELKVFSFGLDLIAQIDFEDLQDDLAVIHYFGYDRRC